MTLPNLAPVNLDGDEEKGDEEPDGAIPTATPVMGTVAVYSSAPVDVWVGGHFIGKTPIHLLSLQVGRHEFEFRHNGMGWSRRQTVAISGGPNRDIRLSPRAP